jgi:hypothetical protein
MRTSMSSTRSRRVRAGIATGAIAAVLLGTIATPAYATSVITVSPNTGAAGAVSTITATGVGGSGVAALFASTTGTPGVTFASSGTCPGTYATTAATGNVNATAVKAGIDAATITLPAALIPGTYGVCVYATNVAAAAPANTGTAPTYTVTPGVPVLAPATGVPGVVTSIVATAPTAFLNTIATPGVNFSVGGSCVATYTSAASATNLIASATKSVDHKVATVTPPAGLAAGVEYNVCFYAGVVDGVSVLLGAGSTKYSATAAPVTLSAATGASGGTNTITATATTALFASLNNVGVNFVTTACDATYQDSPANKAVTASATSTTATIVVPAGVVAATATPVAYRVCIYSSTVDDTSPLLGATTTLAYTVSLPTIALSVTSGKSGGGNTITATGPTNFLVGNATPGVAFTTSACPATYTTATNLTVTGQRIALDKLAITVPSNVTGSTAFKVCVYSGAVFTTSTLIGTAPSYTAVAATTVLSVFPAAGPASGNSTITVTGTGFPETIEGASIGGVPLDPTKIVWTDAQTLTAVTPPHAAASNLTLAVKTSSGTFTLKNAFTYTNGITVSPNTAPHTATDVDVYVVGVGFLTPSTFSTTTTSSDAHIYLVDGVYDASDNSGEKMHPPVAECVDVIVIDDTQLLCSMSLTHRLATDGTLDVVTPRLETGGNGVTTASGNTYTDVDANFTSADIGLGITVPSNTEFAAGTTIVSVTSPTSVVLSNTTSASTTLNATIGVARAVTTIATTDGSATVTGAAGKFKAADVGRPITGTGIAPGTTIVSISGTGVTLGNGATLSKPAVAGATAASPQTLTVSAAAPVLDAAYTMTYVTNGIIDAATLDPDNYSQSIITSGSTFTVSDY